MELGLQGKSVIVTGGAKGIGKACCEGFLAEGARVLCVDVDRRASFEFLQECHKRYPEEQRLFIALFDVANDSECKQAFLLAMERFGGVDILINNVGIEPKEAFLPIHESTVEMWQRILDVNLTSHFLMMREVLPQMMNGGGGAIIHVASVQALQSETNGVPAYGASKSAILGLMRIAALQYAPYNIRVLTVCPGAIDTPLVRAELDDEGVARLGKLHPIGRIGRATEVASAIVFLASQQASFMTGTSVYVDGGLTAKGAWDRSL